MTLTVNLSEELESRIEEEAERSGVSSDEFVRNVLEEKLKSRPPRPDFPAKIIATDLPVRDISLEYEWIEKHRDEYDGKYVALDGDSLIAVGDNYREAAVKARERGVSNALITLVEGTNRRKFISGGFWRE